MLIRDDTLAMEGGAPDLPPSLPLFSWQGWSSRWHLTSVFDLAHLACHERGAFVLVRRETNGTRTPLAAGVSDDIAGDLYDVHGAMLLRAIDAGANEVHVHLASSHRWQDEEVASDIARGWALNIMRTRAYA